MKRLLFTKGARADLKQISSYAATTWGVDRHRRYLAELNRRLSQLSRMSNLGRVRDDIGPGYRSLLVDRHIVLYRNGPNDIEIVRLLHVSMDVRRHIKGRQDED